MAFNGFRKSMVESNNILFFGRFRIKLDNQRIGRYFIPTEDERWSLRSSLSHVPDRLR
jgi:hypothetical protein